MKSIILAAGYATRLYPLTLTVPKPLLPVKGKPILNYLFDDIDSIEQISEHIIITNHKFIGNFEKWLSIQHFQHPVILLNDGTTTNEDRLGAVKDLSLAASSLRLTDDLLVLAGDNLLDFSLKGFVSFFMQCKTSCVMCYPENNLAKQKKTAIITKDSNGRITSYEEKPAIPKNNLAVPPFYCYQSCDIEKISAALSDGCSPDAPGSFAAWLSRHTILHAWEMPGHRYDVGDINSYKEIL